LISKDNIVPALVGTGATFLAELPKDRLEGFFQGKKSYPFHEPGDVIGSALFAGPVIGGMLWMGRKSDDARFRSFTYSMAQGFVVDQAVIQGAKQLVSSQRPNESNNRSFPSGHPSTAFTSAAIVSHYYGKHAAIPAYLAAAYIGYARMDDGAHRLTDVVAGAAIGYIVGRTVTRRADPDRRFSFNAGVPPGGGVGLFLQYRLP
jgi:membrane-associated phospholipid phosphatase